MLPPSLDNNYLQTGPLSVNSQASPADSRPWYSRLVSFFYGNQNPSNREESDESKGSQAVHKPDSLPSMNSPKAKRDGWFRDTSSEPDPENIQELRQAHAEGRLLCRRVCSVESMAVSEPRPFTLLRQGLPQTLFGHNNPEQESIRFAASLDDRLWMHGCKNNTGSINYKETDYKNPACRFYESISGFQNKHEEQKRKLDTLYPGITSGRINQSGDYKPGHKKTRRPSTPLGNNEVSIRECSQIKPSASLLTIDSCKSFDHLQQLFSGLQRAHRQADARYKSLPLLVYRSSLGVLGDACRLEELNLSLADLIAGCQTFTLFAEVIGQKPEFLCSLLTQTLPPGTWLAVLASPPDTVTKTIRKVLPEDWKRAVADRDWASLITLLETTENPDHIFFHNGNLINILGYILEQLSSDTCRAILAGRERPTLQALQKISTLLQPEWTSAHIFISNGCCHEEKVILQTLLIPEALAIYSGSEGLSVLIADTAFYLQWNKISDPNLEIIAGALINALMPDQTSSSKEDSIALQLDEYLASAIKVTLNSGNLSPVHGLFMALIDAGAGIDDSFWAPLLCYSSDSEVFLNDLKSISTAPSQKGKRDATIQSVLKKAKERAQSGQESDSQTMVEQHFQWLQPLFEQALEPDPGWNYNELSRAVIRHYYQRPHPSQLGRVLKGELSPERPKGRHSVDHVTRTQIYAEASLELFTGYPPFGQLLGDHPQLPEILPLALLYHDVYAEVGNKQDEEPVAADCFLRDMRAYGRYPDNTLELVAAALGNKNTNTMPVVQPPFVPDRECTAEERLMRCLVRLPDSIDVMRVYPPGQNFPKPESGGSSMVFNSGMLDLPAPLRANSRFMDKLYAFLKGARDLCGVSGGAPIYGGAGMGKNNYLIPPKDALKLRRQQVERSINPREAILGMLDENVKRQVAQQAGITACEDPHAKDWIKEGHLPLCLAGSRGQTCPISTKIHSEIDLENVNLPSMSTLQKLVFGYLKSSQCLDTDTCQKLTEEIQRLRTEGIPISRFAGPPR